MLRDITIGQYYPVNSIIHRLDPRVKLFGTLVFLVSLFINQTISGYIIATIFLCIAIKVSQVPVKYMIKGLKGIVVIMMISVLFTVFFTDGEVLFRFWIFKLTDEGIIKGIKISIRLIYLVIGSSVMTLTTSPTDISDGLEKSFNPLKYIKVPIHEIAMMISIALRFIPILMEETDKIMKAQMARGADFETGGIIKRAGAMVPLMVPLLVSAVKRALDLATAMEARCYQGGEGRTKMKPLVYKRNDYIVYLIYLAYITAGILIR